MQQMEDGAVGVVVVVEMNERNGHVDGRVDPMVAPPRGGGVGRAWAMGWT